MKVSAHALLDAGISTPDGELRSRAVLPFFTPNLDVQFLLLVMPTGELSLVGVPSQVVEGELQYLLSPTRRNIADSGPAEFSNLLHYDPWWLLRDRDDVEKETRAAIVATNIAEARVGGRRLSDVLFDNSLMRVEGVRVRRRFLGSRLILRDQLPGAFSRG